MVREIAAIGGRAALALGDLGSDDGAAGAAEAAIAAFGGIDIVVNNVGKADEDDWAEPDPAQWTVAYNTNVVSSVRMIRLLLPPMRARMGTICADRQYRWARTAAELRRVWGIEGCSSKSDSEFSGGRSEPRRRYERRD